MNQVGLVAIGRNEGERLHQCLRSVIGEVFPIVYVDSGSTDGSVEFARSLGVDVVELDLSIPFTAARARNEGFNRVLEIHPDVEFVQFVDGDCEIRTGWLELAAKELQQQEQVAIVCGRRRERYPEQSIYNSLCDLEWDTPVGEAKACGGDSMVRVGAFQQVAGFNPSIIAGEEPELCFRLREQGWKIVRLDGEMTLHDAQMTQFDQWWRRNIRAGHAYSEGAWLHGKSPERYRIKESLSIWFWAVILPTITLGLTWLTSGWSLLLLSGYPLLGYRIFRSQKQHRLTFRQAVLYSVFCLLGKFPQAQGQLYFHWSRLLGQKTALIEYKSNLTKVSPSA
ncbi:MAG TPA: glycosyl transferase [Cyanothece sp. UBA12306]|nr:glycosyl transferase [Cyanothece sp. UBA12306]